MAFPSLVVGNMAKDKGLSDAAVMEQLQMLDSEPANDATTPAENEPPAGSNSSGLEAPPAPAQEDDPMKAMQEAIAKDAKKAKP